jgi:hypothetical protein
MTQLMEIRKNADSHSRLQNPAGFRTFPTRPDGGRSLTTEHFSTAAIHLSKLDFLSEGWGVPQTQRAHHHTSNGCCRLLSSN